MNDLYHGGKSSDPALATAMRADADSASTEELEAASDLLDRSSASTSDSEMDEQYIAHKNKAFPAQLDITAPEKGVQVEYDKRRAVLYVHVDGYTALRICRIPSSVEFSGDCRETR